MSDIYCERCGQPWEAYSIYHYDNMDENDTKRFWRGEGCPACDFGQALNNDDRESTLEALLSAAESEIEASDQDPITILTRRGLI